MPSTETEFLTINEVANILRVSTACIRGWVRDAKLKRVRFGRKILIPRTELNIILATFGFEKKLEESQNTNPPFPEEDDQFPQEPNDLENLM